MTGTFTRQVRVEQTRRELDRTQTQILEWFAGRQVKDPNGKHTSQLNALKEVLTVALDRLRERLDPAPAPGDTTAVVYETCRAYEEYLVWVRQVWEYFRVKFDQRDPPGNGKPNRMNRVLDAADEVLWSCYEEPFRHLLPAVNARLRGPAPLAYIESQYSPSALTRDEPQRALPAAMISREDIRQKLEAFVNRLPIPLVALPTTCLSDPWWLVYIGHETGHIVQHDLGGGADLVMAFGDTLSQAVKADAAGNWTEEELNRWFNWGQEIFADVYSLYLMGPWALWAMAQLEFSGDANMLGPRMIYPAPVVRLELMSMLWAELAKPTAPGAPALRAPDLTPFDAAALLTTLEGDPNAARRDKANRAIRALPGVVSALQQVSLQSLGTFEKLCDWRPADWQSGGAVDFWKRVLLGQNKQPHHDGSLREARTVASAAVAAWVQIATTVEDAQNRADACAALADKVPGEIIAGAETGVRARDRTPVEIKPQHAQALGNELADLVLGAT